MLRRSRYCHNVFNTWAAAFTTFKDDLYKIKNKRHKKIIWKHCSKHKDSFITVCEKDAITSAIQSFKCQQAVWTWYTNITYNFITLQADSSMEDYEQDASRHKHRA